MEYFYFTISLKTDVSDMLPKWEGSLFPDLCLNREKLRIFNDVTIELYFHQSQ